MIAQTREFPTISTMTSTESTVIMATLAISGMMKGCRWVGSSLTWIHQLTRMRLLVSQSKKVKHVKLNHQCFPLFCFSFYNPVRLKTFIAIIFTEQKSTRGQMVHICFFTLPTKKQKRSNAEFRLENKCLVKLQFGFLESKTIWQFMESKNRTKWYDTRTSNIKCKMKHVTHLYILKTRWDITDFRLMSSIL